MHPSLQIYSSTVILLQSQQESYNSDQLDRHRFHAQLKVSQLAQFPAQLHDAMVCGHGCLEHRSNFQVREDILRKILLSLR